MVPTLPVHTTERLSQGVVAYEIPQHLIEGRNCLYSGYLIPESDITLEFERIGAGRIAVYNKGNYRCKCGQIFTARLTDPKNAIPEFKYPRSTNNSH